MKTWSKFRFFFFSGIYCGVVAVLGFACYFHMCDPEQVTRGGHIVAVQHSDNQDTFKNWFFYKHWRHSGKFICKNPLSAWQEHIITFSLICGLMSVFLLFEAWCEYRVQNKANGQNDDFTDISDF